MFRALQVIATGQWCGPLTEDAAFNNDEVAYANRVATTLGLGRGSLRVVYAATDPREGPLLEDPNVAEVVPRDPSPLVAIADALAALSRDAGLDAATKTVLETAETSIRGRIAGGG